MVGATEIADGNIAYSLEQHSGLVCVFAGATAGIGQATLERLVSMLHSSTFYILGRNKQRHGPWLNQLRATAPSNKFVYIEAQVSLISDIDTACNQIISAERKVDILCMSPGGMPFAGAKCMDQTRSQQGIGTNNRALKTPRKGSRHALQSRTTHVSGWSRTYCRS